MAERTLLILVIPYPPISSIIYQPRGFRHTSHGAQPGILIWHDSAYRHDNGRYSTREPYKPDANIEHSRARSTFTPNLDRTTEIWYGCGAAVPAVY